LRSCHLAAFPPITPSPQVGADTSLASTRKPRSPVAPITDVSKDDLIKLGTKRFGQPDAEVLARVQSIEDLDRLDTLLLRILDVNGWDELLADDPQ
jgi:hypothetical protein